MKQKIKTGQLTGLSICKKESSMYEYITKYDSPNYGYPSTAPLSKRTVGNNKPKEIVLHHWGDDGQKFENVVNWLCNPKAKTSAHYVLEAGKVACIVDCKNPAWHSGSKAHNLKSIGIECRPEATEGDYQTAAELIAYLWKVYGKLPILRHKDIVATSCPGRWDISKLKAMAEKIYSGETTDIPTESPKPEPTPTPPERTIANVYNANRSLTVTEAIKAGQAISNIILGTSIPEDGKWGPKTKINAAKILQWAMNKDYSAGLEIDGIAGTATKGALGYHTVRLGETQYMVTALEVLLLMNGYNPHGIELPGTLGENCEYALEQFQRGNRLTVDRIAGRNTFLRLIA
jgi:N-acetylmuramoyl-L-alanine amidase CwlA